MNATLLNELIKLKNKDVLLNGNKLSDASVYKASGTIKGKLLEVQEEGCIIIEILKYTDRDNKPHTSKLYYSIDLIQIIETN